MRVVTRQDSVRRRFVAVAGAAALALITAVCFLPVLDAEFVLWDDDVNFLDNFHYRGLAPEHIRWAFTTFHMGPYQPLSWLTLGWDYTRWGMNPLGYHITNLVFHILAAVTLYFAFLHLFGYRRPSDASAPSASPSRATVVALFGALCFAVHPLRVESVAWITERRDVLSGFFYALTLLFYVRFADAESRARRAGLYFAALLAFTCGLLSKAVGVTLPLALLVADVFPLRRLTRQPGAVPSTDRTVRPAIRLIIEKTPFVLIAMALGFVAIVGQQREATLWKLDALSPWARLAQAGYGLCFYAWKSLAPQGLSPVYLAPEPFDPATSVFVGTLVGSVLLTLFALAGYRRHPGPCGTWIAYTLLALPVIGIVKVGEQLVADRYTYLATAPFALFAAGVMDRAFAAATRCGSRTGLTAAAAVCAVAALSVAGLGHAAFQQCQIWQNTGALWSRAIELDPNHHLAYNNRGNYYETIGRRDLALADYNSSIRAKPTYASAYSNRGKLRYQSGDKHGALADYNTAISLHPSGVARILNNRANLFHESGQVDLALADYARALAADADLWEAYGNRALLWINRGAWTYAVKDLTRLMSLRPDQADPYLNRGFALMRLGRFDEALRDLDETIRRAPLIPIAYLNRGITLRALGRTQAALESFRMALAVMPPDWSYRAETCRYIEELSSPYSTGKTTGQ